MTIGKGFLTTEKFATLVVEVEGVVNSRPLTCVAKDTLNVIRSIDFLSLGAVNQLAKVGHETSDDDEYVPTTNTRKGIIQNWKNLVRTLDKFWISEQEITCNFYEKERNSITSKTDH